MADGWQLVESGGRLELRCEPMSGAPGPVSVDFVGGPAGFARRVPGRRTLFGAIGDKARTVIDATCGLGRDAFALACKGYTVTAIERSPAIFALLMDGLRRAEEDTATREAIGGRLRIDHADARDYLANLRGEDRPDVVYLDPMFPPRTKSAAVKKESLALRAIVGDDPDADALLTAARAAAKRHVAVKRMRHAPPIAEGAIRTCEGKTTRYDIYVPL